MQLVENSGALDVIRDGAATNPMTNKNAIFVRLIAASSRASPARAATKRPKPLTLLARPERFELPTPRFVVRGTCVTQSAMITLGPSRSSAEMQGIQSSLPPSAATLSQTVRVRKVRVGSADA